MTQFEQIREQFPRPTTWNGTSTMPGSYCIGGAVYRFAFPSRVSNYYFPYNGLIATALRTLNPNLLHGRAFQYAAKIVRFNDMRQFENAWRQVRLALEEA